MSHLQHRIQFSAALWYTPQSKQHSVLIGMAGGGGGGNGGGAAVLAWCSSRLTRHCLRWFPRKRLSAFMCRIRSMYTASFVVEIAKAWRFLSEILRQLARRALYLTSCCWRLSITDCLAVHEQRWRFMGMVAVGVKLLLVKVDKVGMSKKQCVVETDIFLGMREQTLFRCYRKWILRHNRVSKRVEDTAKFFITFQALNAPPVKKFRAALKRRFLTSGEFLFLP